MKKGAWNQIRRNAGGALIVAAGLNSAMAADWPNWRGPEFNGISRERIPDQLPDRLPVVWKAEVGIGFSSFAVVGDRLLTMGNRDEKDTIWCLDLDSGEVKWSHTYDCALDPRYYEGGPSATPTVHEGKVYTLSKKGQVFRLDLESGAVEWSRDLLADYEFALPEWSFAGSPFIDGDRVLLNVGRDGIALDRESGATLWKGSRETAGYATVVPFGEEERLLFSAKSIFSFESSEGRKTLGISLGMQPGCQCGGSRRGGRSDRGLQQQGNQDDRSRHRSARRDLGATRPQVVFQSGRAHR